MEEEEGKGWEFKKGGEAMRLKKSFREFKGRGGKGGRTRSLRRVENLYLGLAARGVSAQVRCEEGYQLEKRGGEKGGRTREGLRI